MIQKARSIKIQNVSATRRSEIWYGDGSVVLQARGTQFRVYWGILAQQSSFFRDMQSLPQPSDQPSVDGCPVIELHDDVADVEYLLKALFVPTFLAQAALPLPAIGALVRLGRKYDFCDLLDSAVARLTFENPTTIEKLDALVINGKPYPHIPTRIVRYMGWMMDVITLARENNILSVLPCAYYRAVVHYTPLFDGVPRGDGTMAILAPEDQRQCMLARDRLMKARFQPGYSYGWLRKWEYDISECADPASCAEARSARLHFYIDCVPLWMLNRNPLDQRVWCSTCYHHVTESTLTGRKKLWEDLPKFFDLPPWNELKNDL
ncbi:hypothetical protein DFH08DRAFT_695113 [Mycena albidolilacea]|uniref:BTB domain-containing protein n=1 Tax=Mycena albidolilacea TaxID=1033008 RepID=A0AAD7A710_9AGAR|nr:hypothetical protein DFH08DRAFT_695113 [Mycena albidolilacea]